MSIRDLRCHVTRERLFAACAAFMLLAASASHAESTRFGADVELLYDTNVNRAPISSEEQSDTIVSAEGHATRSYLLSYRSGLILRGGVRFTGHTEYSDLSHLSALGRIAYRYQPNPGYTGAWIELAGNAEVRRHSDSDLRDGYLASAAASVGKYFTDRVRLGGGVGYEKRSSDSVVYDTTNTRYWGTIDYRITPRATLYGSVTLLDGDQVFNTASPTYKGLLATYAKAIETDPALAKAFGGTAPLAYRMEAETFIYELGLNVPLKGGQAIDVSASLFDTKADASGQTYDGAMLRAVYMHRFH
ncbi:MAG: hypothetical protein WDZ63_12030 [Burkholderiales bacterium]